MALGACRVDAGTVLKEATKEPGHGGTAVEALVGDVATLNPLFQPDDNARDIDSLIYQGLTTVGPNQDVRPLLARSWVLSSDRLTYTVEIRGDVNWSDGRPFTAADVVFTFHALQDQAYRELQPNARFWSDVKVALVDSAHVRFTLLAPSASFPLALRVGILPEHVFADVPIASMTQDSHSGAEAVGTGPFVPESLTDDHRVVTLKRNPYAKPGARLDHLVFRSYQTLGEALSAVSNGQADAVGGVQPPQLDLLTKRPDLNVIEAKTFSISAALFSLSPDQALYFNPPSVRQALSQAIDRNRIIDEVLKGHADSGLGPIPPSDWAYSAKSAEGRVYDPKAASQALDAAGWVLDQNTGVRARAGHEFRVQLVVADAYPYQDVAEMVGQQLKAIGVDVEVDPEPAAMMVDVLLGKKYQMALAAFDSGSDPDQYSLWHSGAPENSLNFAGLPRQALIDKDLEDGRSSSDRSSRLAAYADFQQLMGDAAPAIFLYEPHYAYVVSRRVQGVRLNSVIEPVDRFQYVADWYVTTKGG
jgi:peptide/nickel transport system substrate-binding protein